MYRNQWAGFDGNPITALLVADSKIDAIHGAIGGLVRYNQLGQETNLAAKLGYAYHAPVGPGTLQLGLNGEFQHKTLEGNWISTSAPDPSIPTATTDYVFDAGFGALFQTKVAHVGVGITHLLESQYDDLHISGARHYYAHAGYRHNFSPTFGTEPMVLTKTDAGSTQLDVMLRTHLMDFLILGAGYRSQDAYVFMLGYQSDHFRVGYSYDLVTSQISNYSSDSQEFLLSYLIK